MRFPNMTRRFLCRQCQRETGHRILASGVVGGTEKKLEREESSSQTFQVFQCEDCGVTTYCVETKIHPGHMMGDPYIQSTHYYPPLPLRIKPSWYGCLPNDYQDIFNEVYTALDNSLFCLASIGARTALDKLIVERITDAGTFKEKLKELVTKGTIDETEKIKFSAVIDAGSASAHRNCKPCSKSMNYIMDILEKIFYNLVIEPEENKELLRKAEELRKSIPKRKQSTKE